MPQKFACPNLHCRPAIEAETNGIGHTHPSRVHPFLLRADPSNASLTVGDVAISTTDVLMDTSEDWQDIDFSTPWNGDSQIRDTQFELTKNAIGVWEFFDHLRNVHLPAKVSPPVLTGSQGDAAGRALRRLREGRQELRSGRRVPGQGELLEVLVPFPAERLGMIEAQILQWRPKSARPYSVDRSAAPNVGVAPAVAADDPPEKRGVRRGPRALCRHRHRSRRAR